MADALVERSTGTPAGITGVEIQLVMTDRTLLRADSEPARLPGYGTVPAGWARTLINGTKASDSTFAVGSPGQSDPPETGRSPGTNHAGTSDDTAFGVWLRRLYTHPGTGDLVAMDSRARIFPPGLRRLIQTRRRHLPHALLRRAHPPPGPHHPLAPRRTHHPHQRRRPLRSLQPHQRNPRLDRPLGTPDPRTRANTPAHHRTHHPHRPHLSLHRTTPARIAVSAHQPTDQPGSRQRRLLRYQAKTMRRGKTKVVAAA